MSNAAEGARPIRPDSAQSWYTLGLLTFAYALSYIDRQMLNLLVDPIKGSLGLTDTQFSFIQGTAFVTAYLLAAPFFGRLVDVTNRRNILIFGVAAWSIFTALCGRATNFNELFLARFGVGLAEACIFPVAMSLIGDGFSAARLPRAMSVFTLGPQLGGGFSLVAGGLILAFAADLAELIPGLNTLEPWQMAFVVVGVPGVLFALFLFSLPEPARPIQISATSAEGPLSLGEVFGVLTQRRQFYGRIYLTIAMIAIVQLGMPSWFPAFLIRAHGMDPASTGYQLGTLSIFFGAAGTLLGPWVARWLEQHGHIDGPVRAAALSSIGMLVSCLAIPLAPGQGGALMAAAGVYFFCGFPVGVLAGATQGATPSRMRGIVGSIYTFVAQFVGYMIAPTIVALITDEVFGDPAMVGYSLQIVTGAASFVACLILFSTLRHHRNLLAEIESAKAVPT